MNPPSESTYDSDPFLALQERLGHTAIRLGMVTPEVVSQQWMVLRRRHHRGAVQYGLLDLLLQSSTITADQKEQIEAAEAVAASNGGVAADDDGSAAEASLMVDSGALESALDTPEHEALPTPTPAAVAPMDEPEEMSPAEASLMLDEDALESEIGDLTPSLVPVMPDQLPGAPANPGALPPTIMDAGDLSDSEDEAEPQSLFLDENALETEIGDLTPSLVPQMPTEIIGESAPAMPTYTPPDDDAAPDNEFATLGGQLDPPPPPGPGSSDDRVIPDVFASRMPTAMDMGGPAPDATLFEVGSSGGDDDEADPQTLLQMGPDSQMGSGSQQLTPTEQGGGTHDGATATLLDMGPDSKISESEIDRAFLGSAGTGSGSGSTAGSGVMPPTIMESGPMPSGPGIAAKMGMKAAVDVGAHFAAGGPKPETDTQRIGRYKVVSKIGRGGMGEVLGVRDRDLNRDVALKQLLSNRGAKQSQIDKFLIEAQVTGQLEHPNIVPVHELGLNRDGSMYFTMKYVRGRSMNQILKELRRRDKGDKSKDPEMRDYHLTELLEMFLKVCDGVAFAHARGVVHRDLKPDNVMVGEFGEVLVMDWGLAKVKGIADKVEESVKIDLEGSDMATAARGGSHTGEVVKTMDGMVLGTPAYMPPEQAAGEITMIDHRSDIYSLGAILYQILTLQLPVEGKTALAVLTQVAQGKIIPPGERAPHRRISLELEAVVLKAMAHKRESRYQSVADLQQDIRAFMEGRTLSAVDYSLFGIISKFVKRNKVQVIAVAAVIIIGLAVFFVMQQIQEQQRLAEERAKQQQIADTIAEGKSHLTAAQEIAIAAQTDEGIAEKALQDFADAEAAFNAVLGIEKGHPEATELIKQVVEGEAAIRGAAESRARMEAEKQAQEAALAEKKENAKKELENARTLLDEAKQVLADNRDGFNELPNEARSALGTRIVGLIEQARTAANLASAQDSDVSDAANELNNEGVELRGSWNEAVSAADKVVEARKIVELANRSLAAGKAAWESARTAIGAGTDSGNEALMKHQNDAFEGLLKANDQFNQALALFTSLKNTDTTDDQARIGEGRLELLLVLTEQASINGAFQRAWFWWREAAKAVPDGENREEIKTSQAEVRRLQIRAQGYDRELETGRKKLQEGNAEEAIGHFRAAQELLDTEEVRAEIERAEFAQKLQSARQAREVALWLDARTAYTEALAIATTEDQRTQVNTLNRELISQGTADLLGKARIEIDRPNNEGVDAAARLLEICLELNPGASEAKDMLGQLAARQETPEGFLYIAGGRCTLGSAQDSDRNPPRVESLSPFYMSMKEVSVEAYAAFVDAGGYDNADYWTEDGRAWLDSLAEDKRLPTDWEKQLAQPSLPVIGISAHEAQAYCAWASETIAPCRLPTDSEWELVARHDPSDPLSPGRKYPWGSDWSNGGVDTATDLRPIGQNLSDTSGYGVLDMGGNACEWVVNTRDGDPPFGVRGASNLMRPAWRQLFAATQKRGFADAGTRRNTIGFRIVRPTTRD